MALYENKRNQWAIVKAMDAMMRKDLTRYDEDNLHIALVLVNNESVVVYDENSDIYYAIDRTPSLLGGMYYHRSTKGKFPRVKKAFEKYSPISMARF